MTQSKKRKQRKVRQLKFKTGQVLVGSCLERLRDLPDASVHSIVTDPPYELSFMGKSWDGTGIAYQVELWTECLRVLKPGGHLLAFGGTRTYHRMVVAIEDAGFEIRDSIHWVYGSGFPKSLNVAKAIEAQTKTGSSSPKGQRKAAMGDAYETTPLAGTPGYGTTGNFSNKDTGSQPLKITTDAAKTWQGWGTALKPAHEPIVVARKPLAGTVAANVLEHGTGALNIDGCRVQFSSEEDKKESTQKNQHADFGTAPMTGNTTYGDWSMVQPKNYDPPGRWPANVIFDEAAGAELDAQSGVRTPGHWTQTKTTGYGDFGGGTSEYHGTGPKSEAGGASRFFYCPKPGKKERNAGLDELSVKRPDTRTKTGMGTFDEKGVQPQQNFHPTVKPVALMRWLVRLITPPGGTVLDPFLGSGTTAVAAILEGFTWVGCEMTDDYLPIIRGRVQWAQRQQRQLDLGI